MGLTSIEWCDRTWSPLRVKVRANAAEIARAKGYDSLVQIAGKMAGHVGPHCEHVSPGCANCYSGTRNVRCLPSNGTGLPFDRRARDLVEPFVDEKILVQPLKWRKPQRVFVENQSDLFGEWVTNEQIDRVFAVMALSPQHAFQVLTKRADRMMAYCMRLKFESLRVWMNRAADGGEHRIDSYNLTSLAHRVKRGTAHEFKRTWSPPLPNVWLGVSVENQETADARIPLLLRTPAAIRFVSYEPILGPVDFRRWIARLNWVIAGKESGRGARPAEDAWIRSARDQCVASRVAFFYKQDVVKGKKIPLPMLDGRQWNEFPEVRQ